MKLLGEETPLALSATSGSGLIGVYEDDLWAGSFGPAHLVYTRVVSLGPSGLLHSLPSLAARPPLQLSNWIARDEPLPQARIEVIPATIFLTPEAVNGVFRSPLKPYVQEG